MASILKAFDLAIDRAWESSKKGDYFAGAVLLGPDGRVLLMSGNDVATGEPHGVQAEVHLLEAYFELRKGENKLPDLKDCTMVCVSEPAAAAGQIVTAGVGKVWFGLEDKDAGLTKPDCWPRRQRSLVESRFEKIDTTVDPEWIAGLIRNQDDAFAAVRAKKAADAEKMKTTWPIDYDHLPEETAEAARALVVREDHRYAFKNRATFGQNYTIDPEGGLGENGLLLAMLADAAVHAASKGNAKNAVLVLDKAGNLLNIVEDESKYDPLKTPIMKAVDWAHEMGRLANMQGTPDRADAPRLPIPHAKDLVFVALREPTMMELARLTQPGNRTTIYVVGNDREGMKTTGADKRMPEFYQKRKGVSEALWHAGKRCEMKMETHLRSLSNGIE